MRDVLAIVWCVTPQVRCYSRGYNIHCNCAKVRTNSSLKKQAEFINRLKDGDIWSHVIIIVKQSVNPKYDARGALAAMQVGDVTKAKAQFWITSIRIYVLSISTLLLVKM